MILIAGLVLCSALFGFGGGIVAAVIMLGYTLFFFSTDNSFIYFTPENLQKPPVLKEQTAVHFSAGCVHATPADADALREMIAAADKQMYQKKHAGVHGWSSFWF